jgi:hypothetical protein
VHVIRSFLVGNFNSFTPRWRFTCPWLSVMARDTSHSQRTFPLRTASLAKTPLSCTTWRCNNLLTDRQTTSNRTWLFRGRFTVQISARTPASFHILASSSLSTILPFDAIQFQPDSDVRGTTVAMETQQWLPFVLLSCISLPRV